MRFLVGSSLALAVITNIVASSSGANILVAVFMPNPSSHVKGLSAIAAALTRRGHNVTVLTSSIAGTHGFPRDSYTKIVHYKMDDFTATLGKEIVDLAFEKNPVKKFTMLVKAFSLMRISCLSLFEDQEMLAVLKESRFKILIGDSFDACDALLGSYLGLPSIAVTTTGRYPLFHEHLYGIPAPSSYVPFGHFALSDRMTFTERVASFFEHNVIIAMFEWTHFGALDAIKDRHGIAPGQSIKQLVARAELWLSMSNFALDYPHPTAPNWVAIGNIADKPAKPLNKEFQKFVDGSGEHGFIIFSLGTYFSELPEHEMNEAFARVFSELPQRVIWRYSGQRLRHLGNNTMLVDWMPQNDLVGHPKARLLIYHGGVSGVMEALYHAVPMVIMPIFAEQDSNALKIEVKGMGTRLQKEFITYETVKAAVTEVLDNPSYTENARRQSNLYRDCLSPPDETVVFWVEHIMKFGGAHLKSKALELNFIQLHSIDVLAFIGGILLAILILMYSCCKRCISCCVGSRKTKVE